MIQYGGARAALERLSTKPILRLPNGIGIDVEGMLRQFYDIDIARVPNLTLGNSPLQGCYLPDRLLIIVEANDPPPRQRFTLAHEFGHLEMHYKNASTDFMFSGSMSELRYFRCTTRETKLGDSCDASQLKRREREADVFAAQLLMPTTEVRLAWHRSNGRLAKCADILSVSKQALEYRLNEMGVLNGRGAAF